MSDFRPGEVIYLHDLGLRRDQSVRSSGPYTVLDPVRTRAGKLRLKGPRGGYMTTWWRKDQEAISYKLEVRPQE